MPEKEKEDYVDDLILNDDLFRKKLTEYKTDFLKYNHFMQSEFNLIYENSYNMLMSDNNFNTVNVQEMLFNRKVFIKETIRNRTLGWKRKELENICRFCANFDKLNLNHLVPCFNYNCKIFYEKKLFETNL